MSWLIIGISGVSCGGKTTLSKMIYNYLSDSKNKTMLDNIHIIKSVKLIEQDNYFLPEDSPRHKWIMKLNHINWELITALDMESMWKDINFILGSNYTLHRKDFLSSTRDINILLIEGFSIFSFPAIRDLCEIKFHVHLPYEICYARRSVRTYSPPDVPGYFETCVWPMYQRYFKEFIEGIDITMVNGDADINRCFNYVLNCIKSEF